MTLSAAGRDPGSFRDPSNAVYHVGLRVLRGLDAQAARDWETLRDAPFFRRAVASGRVVRTEEPADPYGDLPATGTQWVTVLEHERVPFRSYPFEWPFSMLRDAAILHLELLLEALESGFTMADGTAYNVQWRGTSPMLVDVLSFRPAGDAGPWAGYRQFCETFLFPLLLQARRDVPTHVLLRGRLDGIQPHHARRLLGLLGWARKGALRHVYLHAWADRRLAGPPSAGLARELQEAGYGREVTTALVRNLHGLVRSLRWRPSRSAWSEYDRSCPLGPADRSAKSYFVETVARAQRRRLVWDLGCNDGTYALQVAPHADTVVAVDSDEAVIDRLYRERRAAGDRRVLPLVVDLLDPSPGLGWRGRERPGFLDRETPDLVLALALVHHLSVGGGVPLADVVDWLASLEAEVVVELPHREDPMVQRLLVAKPSGTGDGYGLAPFEQLVVERFDVVRRDQLPSGTRTLFHLAPRT